MDQENLDYLKEKLKYSGFEEIANSALENGIKAGKEELQVPVKMDIESKSMDFNLHFKKSNLGDRYFFNKFDAVLHNQDERIEPKQHTFFQNQGVTAKEAFNLLEGRAVEKSLLSKENEPFKAWLQLDLGEKDPNGNFKLNAYHENYGFDLKKTLENLPIKEMQDQTKSEWLLKALSKGNVYPVVMEAQGREEVMFLTANPKFKSVNVYDVQMKPVKTSDLRLDNKTNTEDLSKKKDQDNAMSVKEKIKARIAEPKTPAPRKAKGKSI